jgi:hypothetical protein
MRRIVIGVAGLLALASAVAPSAEQAPKAPAKAPGKAASAMKTEPLPVFCRAELGTGSASHRSFCDVEAGTSAMAGIILCLPVHRGPATVTFDLHGRHIYSEELVKAGSAFRRYTASIVVLTMANGILGRGTVETEFRSAGDLFDRIPSAGGLKAIAPLRPEPVSIEVPEGITDVAIVGERLIVARLDGTDTFTAPGRQIATISNVMVTYNPVPTPMRKPAAKPKTLDPPNP